MDFSSQSFCWFLSASRPTFPWGMSSGLSPRSSLHCYTRVLFHLSGVSDDSVTARILWLLVAYVFWWLHNFSLVPVSPQTVGSQSIHVQNRNLDIPHPPCSIAKFCISLHVSPIHVVALAKNLASILTVLFDMSDENRGLSCHLPSEYIPSLIICRQFYRLA